MKTEFLLIAGLIFSSHANAKPDLKEKTYKCSIKKFEGRHLVKCSDKSETELEPQSVPAAQSVHVKDANGVSLDHVVYLTTFGASSPVLLNKTSGHVLGYDSSGEVSKVSKVYFDGARCTGNAYAFPPDVVLKNKYMVSNQSWPGGSDALKIIGFNSGVVTMLSNFSSGVCTDQTQAMSKPSLVEPASFDSSDLLTIALPLEIVIE